MINNIMGLYLDEIIEVTGAVACDPNYRLHQYGNCTSGSYSGKQWTVSSNYGSVDLFCQGRFVEKIDASSTGSCMPSEMMKLSCRYDTCTGEAKLS